MKFLIPRQELCDLVHRVQNIVAPKTPIPILSNVLIEAVQDRIVLTSTDLTVGVRCTGAAKVIEEGSTTLPAKRFASLLRELTSQHLEVSTNDKDVTQITCGTSTFRIRGLPKAEFPVLPDLSGATKITIAQSELKDLLYRTSFAVSKDDNRFMLSGVFCQIINNIALFVGTDGKRLARAYFPVESDAEIDVECIIPIKAVDEIIKNLNHEEELATLYLAQDKLAVEANDMLILTKLLTGEYPDVDRVIPVSSNIIVSCLRDELMTLLRQISLFTSEQNHSVRFTLMPSELNLNVNSIDIGEGKVSMPVDYSGARFDIAFNPSYFLDFLRHSRNEVITLGFTDSFNPVIIADGELVASHKEFPTPLFVLMPMRLNEEVKA